MEQDIIDNLPSILQHTTRLSCLSFDKDNGQYMTNSKKIAIDFDEVKNLYNIENRNVFELKSNDALYIDKNNIHYFIEFKNGAINDYKNKNKLSYNLKKDLQLKMYDSIFILSDIKYSDGRLYIDNYKNNNGISITNIIDFSKNYVVYILVYNSNKNGNLQIHNHLGHKAKIVLEKFGLIKFKKFFLKEIYIYDENEFETKFINGSIANES